MKLFIFENPQINNPRTIHQNIVPGISIIWQWLILTSAQFVDISKLVSFPRINFCPFNNYSYSKRQNWNFHLIGTNTNGTKTKNKYIRTALVNPTHLDVGSRLSKGQCPYSFICNGAWHWLYAFIPSCKQISL